MSEQHHIVAGGVGYTVSHELYAGIMILALAMRHSVERPATRMGGGTNSYEATLPVAVCGAFDVNVNISKSTPTSVQILSKKAPCEVLCVFMK